MDKEKIKSRLVFWYSILWVFIFVSLYLSYGVYFLDTTSTKSKWVILFSSAVAILLCTNKFLELSFYKHEDDEIKNEVKTYKKSVSILYTFKNIIFILFFVCIFAGLHKFLNLPFVICAFSGLVLFLISGELSSHINSISIVKAKDALTSSLNEHIKLVFSANTAVSFLYWGILGAGVVVLYHCFKDYEALIGYALGISAAAYLENTVILNIKTPVERVCKTFNRLENMKNLIEGSDVGKFFEAYFIALICAITSGANCIGLMGSFLPLIIAANSMFASILAILILKINKSNNVSKFKLKSALFIVSMSTIMLYFQVQFWLDKDFIPIVYSLFLGSIIGIIILFYGKNKKCINELKKIRNVFSNAVIQLFLIALLLICVFKIADGVNYTLFSMYCISVAVLGFNSIIIIPSITNKDIELKNNSKNYLSFSSLLVVFSSIIACLMASEINSVDILDTYTFMILLSGFVIPFICANCGITNILFLTKNMMLSAIKQTKTKEISPNKTVIKALCMAIPFVLFGFAILCTLSYVILHFLGLGTLFVFLLGIILSCIALMFKNEPFGNLLRFSCVLLLGLEFLFK